MQARRSQKNVPWPRQIARVWRRSLVRLNLTARFMLVSIVVIALAMAALGTAVSYYVQSSITEGVAGTAAAGVDSLIANSVNGMFSADTLSDADRVRLDTLFEVGSEAEATRLIQLRIFRPDGTLLYEVSDGVVDQPSLERIHAAASDRVVSDLVELPLASIGPFESHLISLLRLYAPLHSPSSGDVFAVAVLYYSARTLTDIQGRTQVAVWTIVFLVGVGVLAALFAFVTAANRTITQQAGRLSANLVESRRLSDQVRGLHQASEQLRIDAIEANEQLLARVGSDIHDGPLQLLSLAILQLGRASRRASDAGPQDIAPIVSLAGDAVTELRNISSGLVLPELAGLTLAQTVALAIDHYEGATGTKVKRQIVDLDHIVEPDVQICAYRVVQESLTNAFRHAGGLDQSVTAAGADGEIRLDIANAKSAAAVRDVGPLRPKLGLRGMRLRVEAVGGGLSVEMGEARVVVRAHIPAAPRRH